MTDAAVVLLTRRDRSEFLWVQRPHEHAFLGGYWALIGGGINDDDRATADPIVSCAARELEEEFGVAIPTESFVRFGSWETPALFSFQFKTAFYVVDVDDTVLADPRATMNEEAIDAEWTTADRALQKIGDATRVVSPPLRLLVEQLAKHPNDLFLERNDETLTLTAYEVCDGVQVFPLKTHTLPPATTTNCILVGTDAFVVVDPGSDDAEQLDLISRWINLRKEMGHAPIAIFLTHHHPDHVLGAAELSRRFQIPVWAHAHCSVDGVEIARRFEDGDTFPDIDATVWFTPGHASDHCCLHVTSTDTVIGGDLIASFGTILVNPPDGNMGEYLASLARVRDAQCRMLVPAHGWVVPEPSHRLDFYIAHRNAREEKVFNALDDVGPAGPDELLSIAYADTPKAAWPLAVLSVRAHLEHLVELGRVARDGESFVVV